MTVSFTPCMIDHSGRPVGVWLPDMRSEAFLRASIKQGHRTADCWAELTERAQRWQAAKTIIAKVAVQ